MPIGYFVAKLAPLTITTRCLYETLGLDGTDMVAERWGFGCRGLVASADTIRNSLAFLFSDHA